MPRRTIGVCVLGVSNGSGGASVPFLSSRTSSTIREPVQVPPLVQECPTNVPSAFLGHKGAVLQVLEGMRRMKAKDWPPLKKALWKFVREPLMTDPGQNDKWKELANDAQSIRELGKQLGAQLGNQGQIRVDDDEWTVRWYTLCYSCMHFDALTTTLRMLLREKWESVPELTSSTSKPLLHVDLGCGPGTASWAVVKYLAKTSGTQVICDGVKVSFETWNPIRYDDESAWCKGAFGDQVAHAIRLV